MLSEWLLVDQDEATVQELTAEDVSRNASGWLHYTCNRLFHKDMFANIRSSETLLRIHSSAEQFDSAAEASSGPFQVSLPASCNLLALCTCPLSLSACPLHLPFVSLSLCLPFAPASCNLCLPFAPALCLPLLALCTCPVSLSACPLYLPCVSLCFCHYLGPNGVCFAINFCNSPVNWSPYIQ